jgi:exodeoxyribonuclease VII large subunit
MAEKTFYSLSKITGRINEILQPAIGKTFWVKAEISSGRERGGSFYCDLVETDPQGKIIAKMSSTIWSRDLKGIRDLFKAKGLELKLDDGTVVGFECSIQYSPQFGLSLKVCGADPVFAIGEMELKKREIIERLKKEGLFEINKKRIVPILPQKIGVITSKGSAAYNDFVKTLSTSPFGFKIYLADAMMQGADTERSVLFALESILKLNVELVIIIRGGGSKTDLYYLDSEAIARKIANYKIPVWVGIGHEIDTSVLDYVANKNFKTPTAVAEEIIARFVEIERHLAEATARFKSTWAFRIESGKRYIEESRIGVKQGTRKYIDVTISILREKAQNLSLIVKERMSYEKLKIVKFRSSLRALPQSILKNLYERNLFKRQNLKALSKAFLGEKNIHFKEMNKRFHLSRFLNIISIQRKNLQSKASILKAADPQTSLKRGFSLVYKEDGTMVKSVSQAKAGERLITLVSDGKIQSIVNLSEEN